MSSMGLEKDNEKKFICYNLLCHFVRGFGGGMETALPWECKWT